MDGEQLETVPFTSNNYPHKYSQHAFHQISDGEIKHIIWELIRKVVDHSISMGLSRKYWSIVPNTSSTHNTDLPVLTDCCQTIQGNKGLLRTAKDFSWQLLYCSTIGWVCGNAWLTVNYPHPCTIYTVSKDSLTIVCAWSTHRSRMKEHDEP